MSGLLSAARRHRAELRRIGIAVCLLLAGGVSMLVVAARDAAGPPPLLLVLGGGSILFGLVLAATALLMLSALTSPEQIASARSEQAPRRKPRLRLAIIGPAALLVVLAILALRGRV